MNFQEKNLKELYNTQLEVWETINEIDRDLNVTNNYEIYKNFNDEYVLKYKNHKGDLIHYTSYYNPNRQAENMIKDINFSINRQCIVCVGVGLGYQIDKLLDGLGNKSIILVVERDIKLLAEVLKLKDYSEEIKNRKLLFVVGELEDENLFNRISNIMRLYSFNITLMQGVNFETFDLDYNIYVSEIFKYINAYKDTYYFALGNDVDDTLIGIKNRFDNIPRYIRNPGLNDIKEKFEENYKDKPAIIIASGPSLNKNIHLLKNAKGKALLLACDGSMSSLKKYDIVPDSVGSVERIYKTYEAFYKDKKFENKVVLTAPAIVRKEIPDTFNNKILSFFKNENYSIWFNDAILNKGTVWSGASVSHMLFGLAHELGCNPIILVGQDLAYSEEGVSHVSEAEVKEEVNLKTVEVYVKGKNGKMIPSTYVWKNFLTIYEEGLRVVDRKVIDATEGGALIEGTEISTLEDAINKYCTENIKSLRSCVDAIDVSDEYIENATDNIIKLSKIEIKRMQLYKKKAEIALDKNIKSINIILNGIENEEELNKIYDCIDYVENKIVKKVFLYPTIKMLLQYLIYRAALKISKIEDKSYTKESLKINLEVHQELLLDVIKFLSKGIDVFETGIINVRDSKNNK